MRVTTIDIAPVYLDGEREANHTAIETMIIILPFIQRKWISVMPRGCSRSRAAFTAAG